MGYPASVQLIERPRSRQWYVNFPNALALALDMQKGEKVEWEVESRSVMVMVRVQPTKGRKLRKTKPRSKGKA